MFEYVMCTCRWWWCVMHRPIKATLYVSREQMCTKKVGQQPNNIVESHRNGTEEKGVWGWSEMRRDDKIAQNTGRYLHRLMYVWIKCDNCALCELSVSHTHVVKAQTRGVAVWPRGGSSMCLGNDAKVLKWQREVTFRDSKLDRETGSIVRTKCRVSECVHE